MIGKAEWSIRQEQWAEYYRWARSEAPPEYMPEDALACLGTLLEFIPASSQSRPGKTWGAENAGSITAAKALCINSHFI